jgi:ATP-dependent DNA helicase DinG
MPSRLLSAFPPGVPIRRIPLDDAITRVEERLSMQVIPAMEPVE